MRTDLAVVIRVGLVEVIDQIGQRRRACAVGGRCLVRDAGQLIFGELTTISSLSGVHVSMMMMALQLIGKFLQRVGHFLLGDFAIAIGVHLFEHVVDACRAAATCCAGIRCRELVDCRLKIALVDVTLTFCVELRK